jgi:heme-degrading monooxygenase HmoA
MAVKILIKRQVPEKKEAALNVLLREMRNVCNQQAGYISGETLKRLDYPDQYLVISTWQSADAWRNWLLSEARKEIQDKIDDLLGSPTQYELYAYN